MLLNAISISQRRENCNQCKTEIPLSALRKSMYIALMRPVIFECVPRTGGRIADKLCFENSLRMCPARTSSIFPCTAIS
jgi:hypothetical protein